MITAQIQEIEALAEGVLDDVFGSAAVTPLPVDLDAVLQAYGLSLKEGPFEDPSVVGYYDRPTATIFGEQGTPYPRKAFTVAHEIGHFVRHDQVRFETFYRKDAVDLDTDKELEAEANCFAASLLMPRSQVERYWSVLRDVNQTAGIFGVSVSAMQWRLHNLGLASNY